MHLENFPNLKSDNHSIKSQRTFSYNCIPWTFGKTDVWWSSSPGYYWPRRIAPGSMHVVSNVIKIYENFGFIVCKHSDTSKEDGIEKVALYATAGFFVHAALQREDGIWTSKLGEHEDIIHETAECLLGGEMESIACVLKRKRVASK